MSITYKEFIRAYPSQVYKEIIYLAAPYTHTDIEVRFDREKAITAMAAKLMTNGYKVFSPITHGIRIARELPSELRDDHKFWMRQFEGNLPRLCWMIVYQLDGWQRSKGVQYEEKRMKECGRTIVYLMPEEKEDVRL